MGRPYVGAPRKIARNWGGRAEGCPGKIVQFSDQWSKSRTNSLQKTSETLILVQILDGPGFARSSAPLYVLNGERLQGVVRTFNLCELAESSKHPAITRKRLVRLEFFGYWACLCNGQSQSTPPRSLKGMKSILAQLLSKRPQHNAWLLPRMFAAMLSVFFLTAVPALADTVRFNQVVQTQRSSKGPLDLKINTVASQDPGGSGTKVLTQQNGPRNETPGGAKPEAVLSNVVVTSGGQDIGIDIVEEGEVEGTICDCGEILVAHGAFPKWPFLFLGAVPFVFISDCDTCDEPPGSNPTPTPPSSTPTPPKPTPEPASLLLFGFGLLAAGAGLRRRHGKAKVAAQAKAREEE